MSFLSSGEIISLENLLRRLETIPFQENQSYRLTGEVISIDVPRRICQIQHGEYGLVIDLELIPLEEVVINTKMQFIGELISCRSEAKVCNTSTSSFCMVLYKIINT